MIKYFVINKKVYWYMLICSNADGVRGQRKVRNPCSKQSYTLLHYATTLIFQAK